MRRAPIVLIIVGVLAVAEIALIATVAGQIGIGWTLLALVGTAALGGYLWRREGSRAWASLAQAQGDPDQIGKRVTDTALIFIGGLLLLLPGFLSDVLGLVCLIPFTRPLARGAVQTIMKAMTRRYRDQAGLIDLQLRPDTVVPGETVDDQSPPNRQPRRPDGDDDLIIRGEIEP
ncbi:MAG: FxsA family protein [Propioniciclava sp.]|uniref:FxsA family protein n=1 Tax=Propioniciclava sp. TaxID=2038686 RepID=UPI0039E2A14F